MGVQTEAIESVPDGMTAWDIERDILTIYRSGNGSELSAERYDIRMKWHDDSVPARPCCEFISESPIDIGDGRSAKSREFNLVSNSYLGVPYNDDIILADYDKNWIIQFELMKMEIERLLGTGNSASGRTLWQHIDSGDARKTGDRYISDDTGLGEREKTCHPCLQQS